MAKEKQQMSFSSFYADQGSIFDAWKDNQGSAHLEIRSNGSVVYTGTFYNANALAKQIRLNTKKKKKVVAVLSRGKDRLTIS